MSNAFSSLEAFADISESMAKAADSQEWDQLVLLGQERDRLLKTLPENLAPHLLPAEQPLARKLIENCRQLDAQTAALLGKRKDELRVLLREPVLA